VHILNYITLHMKIGIIIPSTSKGRSWASYKDSYLYTLTLKSLLLTYDKEHEYVVYVGIDKGDTLYDTDIFKESINRFVGIMQNVDVQFHYMDGIEKGHLTVMWNRLFDFALDDGCDYFFQCGDDVRFETKGWTNDCINVLDSTNGVGLVGPINNNPRILTQSFVSRKHKELFGYYFPPDIKNWFCDDWINEVYKKIGHFYPLRQHVCVNLGGKPRYDINNDSTFTNDFKANMERMRVFCTKIVERDYARVQEMKK